MTSMELSRGDFHPWNTWVEASGTQDGYGENTVRGIQDSTTGRVYRDESRLIVWVKCLSLAIATPVAHGGLTLVDMMYRIVKLVTFSHFWLPETNIPLDLVGKQAPSLYEKEGVEEGKRRSVSTLKTRAEWASQDLEKLVLRPLIFLGLELSAVYGVFNPYDGRKLCASFEKTSKALDPFQFQLAPSFQPIASVELSNSTVLRELDTVFEADSDEYSDF